MLRLPWGSSGMYSGLPLQGARVQSLVRALTASSAPASGAQQQQEQQCRAQWKCKCHLGQRATVSREKRVHVGLELPCWRDPSCLERTSDGWIICREVSLLACSWKGEEGSTKGDSGSRGTSGQALEGIGMSCSFPQAHLGAWIYCCC